MHDRVYMSKSKTADYMNNVDQRIRTNERMNGCTSSYISSKPLHIPFLSKSNNYVWIHYCFPLLILFLTLHSAGCESSPQSTRTDPQTSNDLTDAFKQSDMNDLSDSFSDSDQNVSDLSDLAINRTDMTLSQNPEVTSCIDGSSCPRGYKCVCAFDEYCHCDAKTDRGSCESDADCRLQEHCVERQRPNREVSDRICWLDESELTAKVCPGSAGCMNGSGPLLAGARSMIITPDAFETAKPAGLDDFHINFVPPLQDQALWRDCGYDNLCPGDEGYITADHGENDQELQGIFIAGFFPGRPAQYCPEDLIGCDDIECCVSRYAHDHLKAQVLVLQQGENTVGLISLDVFGLSNTDIEQIRWAVHQEVEVDLLVIGSTHSHEGPDTSGQYGAGTQVALRNGQDPRWMSFLRQKIVEGVKGAIADLAPAKVESTIVDEGILGLAMSDSRPPYIFDDNLPFIHITHAETGAGIASMVSVGNHPEVLWSKNPYLSSDYFHYVRKYMREGLAAVRAEDGSELKPQLEGVGGVILTFAGALGGLINPGKGIAIDYAGQSIAEIGFAKADAVGQQIASRLLQAKARGDLRSHQAMSSDIPLLKWSHTKFLTPIENPEFLLAGFILRIIRRDIYNAKHLGGLSFSPEFPMAMSEVSIIQLGGIHLFTAPGEVFPELLTGGYPYRSATQSPVIGDVLEARAEATCNAEGLPITEEMEESEDPENINNYPCVVAADQTNPPDWSAAPNGPYIYDLFDGHPFFIGLGGDFLGYMVPEYDFIFGGAGKHYEESNSTSIQISRRWTNAIKASLDALRAD